MIKLITQCFVCIFTFVLLGIFASNSHAAEAICQSEQDCRELCEQYEQGLNNDDSVEEIYSCTITGFTEVQTIEEDGTTNGHTEFNCLCIATGMKDEGDGSDGGGDGKPKPPVILDPIIPDYPGGELPPDNGFADCLKKAQDREIDMRHRCADEYLQDWNPDVSEELRRFISGGNFLSCIENAEKIGDEMKKECHKKWSKKSIGQIKKMKQSN